MYFSFPPSFMQSPVSQTSSPWFAISIGLLGLIIGYGLSTAVGGTPTVPTNADTQAAAAANDEPTNAGEPADADDDAVLGDDSATVTVIEFTDYECPFCARHYNDTFGHIKKNYVDTGKVKYVVRDFPLSFHQNAHAAAEAAECAGEQGKYFAMHDKLFTNQATWSGQSDAKATFKQYAKDIGLTQTAFDTCLDTGEMAAEVDADLAAGTAAGINGTPGFWIVSNDGQSKSISGAYPYATFQAAIDAML